MTRDEAIHIARSLIGPAATLGYLVGRGPSWPTGDTLKTYTRSIGEVMGRSYLLLDSVWHEHPDLDPGRNRDPLSLLNRETPADAERPSELLRYITEIDVQLETVVNTLCSDETASPEMSIWIKQVAADLRIALAETRSLLTESRV